jgi:hypothetical protein
LRNGASIRLSKEALRFYPRQMVKSSKPIKCFVKFLDNILLQAVPDSIKENYFHGAFEA